MFISSETGRTTVFGTSRIFYCHLHLANHVHTRVAIKHQSLLCKGTELYIKFIIYFNKIGFI